MNMLALMLISLCTVTKLTTGLTQAQWQRPAYYYNRVQHLTPAIYASPTSFNPTYLQANGPKPDCKKGKNQNEVTFQSGTNSYGTISQALNTQSNKNQLTVPMTGFQPSTVYPFTRTYQAQAQTQNQQTTRNIGFQNSFNQPEQFTVTPELLHHSPATTTVSHNNNQNQNHNQNQNQNQNQNHNQNQNQNQNQNHNQNQNQNSKTSSIVHNNINITTSNLFQIPGMEHLKNCVPIPGTDGACVILQDDTKTSEHHSETSTTKSDPPNKELIYAPPKNSQSDFNFKPLGGNQNQNGNYFAYNVDGNRNPNGNRFNNQRVNVQPISSFARGNNGPEPDTPFNLRNPFVNVKNNNNRFRPGFRVRNNKNQFPGQNAGIRGFVPEPLPTPQPFHLNPNENALSGDSDKHSEGSEKVAGEKIQPPFDNLPESKEFYMRFLRLWSMYHKRYGCSFKPTVPNVSFNSKKRSVKKST